MVREYIMLDKAAGISVIDRSLEIDGAVTSRGRLIVKGSLKGTLDGETVIIAEEGIVEAEAKAANMTVGGTFKGDIQVAEELTILSTGSCSGKVVCKDLVVETGGMLDAEVTCTRSREETIRKGISVVSKE